MNIQCLHIDKALTGVQFECVTEVCDAKMSGILNNLGMPYFVTAA